MNIYLSCHGKTFWNVGILQVERRKLVAVEREIDVAA
jgi:hypothetical protein